MIPDFTKPPKKNPALHILEQTLHYARERTYNVINQLSMEVLDFNFDSKSNSIGTLLKHTAALEFYYQTLLFKGRTLNSKEMMFWGDSLPGQLYKRKIQGNNIDFYLSLLNEVRAETFELLSNANDDWLFQNTSLSEDVTFSNYYWLFHLAEDEIGHLGQIKIILKRLHK